MTESSRAAGGRRIENLWTPRDEPGSPLKSALRALSAVYEAAVRARLFAYRRGIFPAVRVPAKVIVVGNLTVGGSGKTPVAAWLASRLRGDGRRPAVILRGYGRKVSGLTVVSDGSRQSATLDEAGDEAILLSRRLEGIPVIACADRVRAAEFAISRFGAEWLVLDDGFSHLRLARDFDLLVIDAGRDPTREYLLPRGPLREPLASAARADALILSRAEGPEPPAWPWLAELCPEAPLFAMSYRTRGLVPLEGGGISRIDTPTLAFCGIGSPGGFFKSLADAGVPVVGRRIFRDHHPYGPADLATLVREAKAAGAARLVTTEKDAVKIQPGWARGMAVDALRVEPMFFGESERLYRSIIEKIEGDRSAA